MSELFWTAAELAQVMGVPLGRVYELTAAGRLPVLRYGARRYYPKHATLQWFDTEALQAVESRAGPPADPLKRQTSDPHPVPGAQASGLFLSEEDNP